MILIPVKDLERAKQRLAPVLDQATRTALAQAMLSDVLQAVAASETDEVSLVTCDAFAADLARQYGFGIIRDNLNLSETDAIEMACRICDSRGVNQTLVIPGDIPMIQAAEIRSIYDSAPVTGTVLVPSLDKRGTNAVLRRPTALFPLRFGNDSFLPHLAAAIATNKSCVVLSLPGVALDIDTADDLHQVAINPGNTRSQILVRKLGFGQEQEIATATKVSSSDQKLVPAKV
jgi:2-phospho-L-lactate guanylyltransferase